MGVYRIHFLLFEAEVSDYLQKVEKCGLQRAFDAVPHINTPLDISVNSKHKINYCQEKSHIINFHEYFSPSWPQ